MYTLKKETQKTNKTIKKPLDSCWFCHRGKKHTTALFWPTSQIIALKEMFKQIQTNTATYEHAKHSGNIKVLDWVLKHWCFKIHLVQHTTALEHPVRHAAGSNKTKT